MRNNLSLQPVNVFLEVRVLKNKVVFTGFNDSNLTPKQSKAVTQRYLTYCFSLLIILWDIRYTLGKEVLIFTSSQNSPVTQHSQYISVLPEAGAPQKFPTRVTGQCHDKGARERGRGPGNGKRQD